MKWKALRNIRHLHQEITLAFVVIWTTSTWTYSGKSPIHLSTITKSLLIIRFALQINWTAIDSGIDMMRWNQFITNDSILKVHSKIFGNNNNKKLLVKSRISHGLLLSLWIQRLLKNVLERSFIVDNIGVQSTKFDD